MKQIQVRSKVWLALDEDPFFGQGRETLLRLIQDKGSINAAAKDMGLSYRKAWSLLQSMEEKFGRQLVRRSKGGTGGGTACLTEDAIRLLDGFDRLQEGLNAFVDAKFAQIFGGMD